MCVRFSEAGMYNVQTFFNGKLPVTLWQSSREMHLINKAKKKL